MEDFPGVGEYELHFDYLSTIKKEPEYSMHCRAGQELFKEFEAR